MAGRDSRTSDSAIRSAPIALACGLAAYVPVTVLTLFIKLPYQLATLIWLVLSGLLFWFARRIGMKRH